MLILSHAEVLELLDLDLLIAALAGAMADLSTGEASVPKRNVAKVGERGILAAMPAWLGSADQLGAKLVLVFPGNASRGVETHQAIVAVFDPETGVPRALMDGGAITALRTAAGSALATRLCAREDAAVLAVLGTGVQARTHARAVARVRPIRKLVFAGRDPAKVEAIAGELGGDVARDYEEAVRAADVVCACTSATEPIVRREWLRPGTHVNAVGMARGPELDPGVFDGAIVIVESRGAVIGSFPDGAEDITAAVRDGLLEMDDAREVGELVIGARTGRTAPDQITVYRSVGVAAQDVAAAALVLAAARERGIGTEVDL